MRTLNFNLNLKCFLILLIFTVRLSKCEEDAETSTTHATGDEELVEEFEEEEPEPLPKLWKCCPEDQFFNLASSKCESSADVNLNLYEIDPGIYDYSEEDETAAAASEDYDEEEDTPSRSKVGLLEDYEEDYVVGTPKGPKNFEVRGIKYPTCTYGYELFPLYNSNNDATSSPYTILPKNGSLYLTLTEESLIYSDFCVDRGFKRSALQYSNKASLAGFGRLASYSSTKSYEFLGTVVAFCRPEEEVDCFRRPCMQACCPYGEIFDAEKGRCDEARSEDTSEIVWKPEMHNKQTGDLMSFDQLTTYWNITEEKIGSTFPIRIFYSKMPSCKTQAYNLSSEIKIFMDGTLFAGGGWFNYSKFCVHNIESVGENSTVTFWRQAQVCVPDNPEAQGYLKWINLVDLTMIPAMLVISVVFLVLLFIHFWIRNRSKLFGAMMLSTIASLASFYTCLSVIKFSGGKIVRSHPTTCTTLGFLVQFTNLSSFFWLNAICVDIWFTFRKMKLSRPRKKSVFGKSSTLGFAIPKFKWYAIYAWGIPFMVVSVTILIQYLPDRLKVDLVMPSVGKGQCFFGTNISTLLYLHMINAPVLFANLILFFSFVYNLCCGLWSKSTDMIVKQQHRKHLKTVIKIFFVMGLTWTAEIVSFFLNWSVGSAKTYKYVVFFDFINSMQGFTMFCVLFFDSDTIRMIKAKIGQCRNPSASNNESTLKTFVSRMSSITLATKTPSTTNQVNVDEESYL